MFGARMHPSGQSVNHKIPGGMRDEYIYAVTSQP